VVASSIFLALARSVHAMDLDLQPTLVGDILRARPLKADDLDALYGIASDARVWEQHPSKDRGDLEVFRRWFDEAVACQGALVVEDLAAGEVIGSSRFVTRNETTVEIDWTFLRRDRWGGLWNGELKRLMLTHAFAATSVVVFIVHDANFRSQRAVAKLGAREVAREADCQGRGTNIRFELDPERFYASQT
jgi:RimJ/RimL family protein N-acetyltransferase